MIRRLHFSWGMKNDFPMGGFGWVIGKIDEKYSKNELERRHLFQSKGAS